MPAKRQDGFTLIELLLVLVIIAVLTAIAVPAYLTFRAQAQDTAAKSALNETLKAANAYALDNDGYTTITLAKLRKDYDRAIPSIVKLGTTQTDYFCIHALSDGGTTFWLRGPESILTTGTQKKTRPPGC
jgi:type IV pilus assembly protein PilA